MSRDNENNEVFQKYYYPNESYSGCDMVATILMPHEDGTYKAHALGELMTISYSIHMDRKPVRSIGNINAKDYVMGPRTIAGSLVFAVFNTHFAKGIIGDIKDKYNPGYEYLMDELPPFDIIISMANEYGLRSKLVIYGVRLVNEGQVMSINDVYTENTYQFVATDIEYLNKDNGYDRVKNKYGSYYIIKEQLDSGSSSTDRPSLTPEPLKPFAVQLNYKMRTIATNSNKGIVDFWLVPVQREGILKIEDVNQNISLNVNVAEKVNGNNRISVHLPPGTYTASWKHDDVESNTVSFVMPLDNGAAAKSEDPAPLIEAIGDTFIKILCNSRNHTKVIYEDEDGNNFSLKLSGRRAVLKNLAPNKVYNIATCTENFGMPSAIVTVTTLSFGHDEYLDFMNYIMYNSKTLTNPNINVYATVINKAKDISMGVINYETMTDTFVEANKQYNKELSDLKQENFPDIESYQKEVDKLQALIDASVELITISAALIRDKIYGYNYKTFVVEPPVLENIDGCTSTFIVNNDIKSMDFYRQFAKTTQFSKTIEKNNFKRKEEVMTCRFDGRPETRYYTYATNEQGYKSPRVDFYVYGDSYKAHAIENLNNSLEIINNNINRLDIEIGESLDSSLSSSDKKRVYTEILKSDTVKQTKAPVVKDKGEDLLTVNIIDDLNALKNINARVAISEVDYALMNTCKYKIDIDKEVTFNTSEHGVKPNKDYVIWIEDSDEKQISDAITVRSNANDMLEFDNEYYIRHYFVNELANVINNGLNDSKVNSKILEDIIHKNINDLEISKVQFFDSTLKDISNEYPKINNMFEVLYTYFKVTQDATYNISNEFFIRQPVYKDETTTVYEDCVAKVVHVSNKNITYKDIDITGETVIDLSNPLNGYTMVHFVKKDLSKRSGFILVNNHNGKIRTNKIKVKAGV